MSMDQLEAVRLKTTTFGEIEVAKVKSDHADKLYKFPARSVGKRQAALRMQVARRVWNEWARDHKLRQSLPEDGAGHEGGARQPPDQPRRI
jgi:hypothetical protein